MQVRLLKSKWVMAVGVLVLLLLFWAVGILKFNINTTYTLSIPPSRLLPFVSHTEARQAVCGIMRGQLFSEACQEKFNQVGKNDREKIDSLLALVEKAHNSQGISDYERYMIGQVVFASLPTKDSPLASRDTLFDWFTLPNEKNIAHAQEQIMSEEEFKALMEQDLRKIADELPEGDNAWVATVMISRYSWVNGERQPLYSEEYAEWVDPYPASSDRNERNIAFHVRSFTGGRSVGEVYSGRGEYAGTSNEIFYSFTISSWRSRPDGGEEKEPVDIIDTQHYTEDGYTQDDLMGELFRSVNMDEIKKSTQKRDEKVSKSDSSFTGSDFVYVPISEKECRRMAQVLKLETFNLEYKPDTRDEKGIEFNGVCNWLHKGSDVTAWNYDNPFKVVEDAELALGSVYITKFGNKKMQEEFFKKLKSDLREYYGPTMQYEESAADRTFITTNKKSEGSGGDNFSSPYIPIAGGDIQIFGLVGECYYNVSGGAFILTSENPPYYDKQYHERGTMPTPWGTLEPGQWINKHPDFDHGLGEIKQVVRDLSEKLRAVMADSCNAR